MDKLIAELEELTKQGLLELGSMDYEQVVEFMERRTLIVDELLEHIPSLREKIIYKGRIQAVLSHDHAFIAKMMEHKDEASLQLAKLDKGRTQRNAYDMDSAYDVGSVLFDKKK
ncbi:hypothetical protein SAMN03159341_111139 [Paenibacillus sp. 1_12]|uniref:hypothetical protein n=1 Tax=Paenibacillus sp. 1_12 TaxID=1566278 RepID=UPI0008E15FA4|nr:hypothetical protein [Paenibacillus sp. 1_12]SFL89792.1 hypothetical protein SAMN03159341_111139 [Paenibacillus sp. 1_12]